MKKSLLLASLCAAFATGALAQSAPGGDSAPAADTRAADLNRTMEIRNWQAGPSAGDAAARADASPPAATDQSRAADLNKLMDIRGWQAGPSAGDTAARVDASTSQPAPGLTLGAPGAQDALQHESTP
jgi:hypothetical protein